MKETDIMPMWFGNQPVYRTPDARRALNNTKIKAREIACHEELPLREDSKDVKLRDLDDICKKAIATLIACQVACDTNAGKYQESIEFFKRPIRKYRCADHFTAKEKRVMDGTASEQDVVDVAWGYETYWALCWALRLVQDIEMPSQTCDCDRAIKIVFDCKDLNDFRRFTKIRDIDEILDMLDLYYRYHWACVEKRINPEKTIGELNEEVVAERRKGLEWLVSDVEDWDDISLDT
ncbi:MAG: DUF4272 domain-containing protein [Coriobacteriales bacterium]|nr:DUF4272 domain-containing protein [Coriobacteriales bacterium]